MKTKKHVGRILTFVSISLWFIAVNSTIPVSFSGEALAQSDNVQGAKPVLTPEPADQQEKILPDASGVKVLQQQNAGGEEPERYVTIDFENVDINLFIKYISELTGKNFIIDKAVRGNVTIVSPTKKYPWMRHTRFLNLSSRSRILQRLRPAPLSRSCPPPMPGLKILRPDSSLLPTK